MIHPDNLKPKMHAVWQSNSSYLIDITFVKEVLLLFLGLFVCWLVCLYSCKITQKVIMKFREIFGGMCLKTRNNRLGFGGELNPD